MEMLMYGSMILAYLAFLINFRKFRYNDSLIYFIAFSILVFTELIGVYQYQYLNVKTFLTYYVGIDILYMIIVMFFYHNILNRKNLILGCILIYSIVNILLLAYSNKESADYELWNKILFQNYKYIFFFNLIVIIIILLTFFYETFNSDKILKLQNYFPFWVTISLMITNIGSMPIYLSIGSLQENIELFQTFNGIISSLGYFLLTIGIFMNKPSMRRP